jgi:hypothetical protein
MARALRDFEIANMPKPSAAAIAASLDSRQVLFESSHAASRIAAPAMAAPPGTRSKACGASGLRRNTGNAAQVVM